MHFPESVLNNFKMHLSVANIEASINKINFYTSNDAKAAFEGYADAFLWKRPVHKATIINNNEILISQLTDNS